MRLSVLLGKFFVMMYSGNVTELLALLSVVMHGWIS